MTNEHAWWFWLTESTAALQVQGHDPAQRARHCGHVRALEAPWCSTVGMWRVRSDVEIAQWAGVDLAPIREFARAWGLAESTEPRIHRVELAERCARGVEWLEAAGHAADTFAIVGRRLGVLPVEALLYARGLQVVMSRHGFAGIDDYLKFSCRVEDRAVLWKDVDGFSEVLFVERSRAAAVRARRGARRHPLARPASI